MLTGHLSRYRNRPGNVGEEEAVAHLYGYFVGQVLNVSGYVMAFFRQDEF